VIEDLRNPDDFARTDYPDYQQEDFNKLADALQERRDAIEKGGSK
jgi:hypothetical protein